MTVKKGKYFRQMEGMYIVYHHSALQRWHLYQRNSLPKIALSWWVSYADDCTTLTSVTDKNEMSQKLNIDLSIQSQKTQKTGQRSPNIQRHRLMANYAAPICPQNWRTQTGKSCRWQAIRTFWNTSTDFWPLSKKSSNLNSWNSAILYSCLLHLLRLSWRMFRLKDDLEVHLWCCGSSFNVN